MRFFKSYLRYKIIKSSDNIDAFLQNYPAEKRELLEQFLGEILAISSEKMDLGLLKNLIKEKIDEFKLDVSVKELEAIYMAIASKIHKKIGKILDKKVSFIFDDIDKDALGSMRKGFYWMGKEYNENLQTKLKNLIEKNFNGEISQDEIPKVLKDEFGAIINADENYFRGVSDHISLQAQNVATITQGSKYGVKYYKVLAIMDKKTSEICRSMHGRIIPAGHLENQADKIINAKTMAQKKAAATWQSKAYNGRSDKLASNFGLPPYHFRCRTEVVPVWIDEEDIGGIKMKNTMPVSKDEIIRHIDKTGVERVLKKDNYFEGNHSTPIYKKAPKLGIIKALNSINEVAPNARIQNYTNAFCDNGYCLVFNGDEIVTAIPPKNGKKCAYEYFKRGIIKDKKEVIKWSIGNLKSHFMA